MTIFPEYIPELFTIIRTRHISLNKKRKSTARKTKIYQSCNYLAMVIK